MHEYASGDVAEIATVHAENMELAGICRVRHGAIVKRLAEIEQSN